MTSIVLPMSETDLPRKEEEQIEEAEDDCFDLMGFDLPREFEKPREWRRGRIGGIVKRRWYVQYAAYSIVVSGTGDHRWAGGHHYICG
jgi:hypothetical protein